MNADGLMIKRIEMSVKKVRKSTRSRIKKMVPIVSRPRNVLGCCERTTATAPVDIVPELLRKMRCLVQNV